MKSKIAVWILVLLLAFQLVNALGVRPAKTSIAVDEFEENNIQIEGKLWVVNNENREFTVGIYLDGEMADFVKLKTSEKKLTFTPEDDAKEKMSRREFLQPTSLLKKLWKMTTLTWLLQKWCLNIKYFSKGLIQTSISRCK